MPTYVYETIPGDPNAAPRRFEVIQRMTDEPLKTHAETGEAVRRVIIGGIGVRQTGLKRSVTMQKSSAASRPCRHHHHHD